MVDAVLFFCFTTLIARFCRSTAHQAEKLDEFGRYIEEAHKQLKR